ncbi:MAG: S-layer homology domain-containing protein [Clostridia bacterium]|nr:S-layer homology domain-containing protein [Clostridia bacterium]
MWMPLIGLMSRFSGPFPTGPWWEAVSLTAAGGLLRGVDEKGTFAGENTLTRAQMATVYCRGWLVAVDAAGRSGRTRQSRSCGSHPRSRAHSAAGDHGVIESRSALQH